MQNKNTIRQPGLHRCKSIYIHFYVYLSEEIAQCENLIDLHRTTQGAIYIELANGPDLGEIKLIPLVLLTILEDIFKHGILMTWKIRPRCLHL